MATSNPVELGPFQPPADYPFEAELQGEPPRPRPPVLAAGRHAVGRRKLLSGLLIAGAICTSIAPLPFVQECALYLVPLQYLYWIGFGLGVAAIARFLWDRVFPGPYRYVEHGRPLIVRIQSVGLIVSRMVAGAPIYRYAAVVEYRDPESGELRTANVATRDLSQLLVTLGLATTYRVGDYATAVYLPGKNLEKSLRLYGFLELKPGLGLIRTRPSQAWTGRQTALLGLGAFGFVIVALWVLYTLSKFMPLSADPFSVITVVVLGAGCPLLGLLVWRRSKPRQAASLPDGPSTAESQRLPSLGWLERLASPWVAGILGGAVTFCAAASVNALFDTSPPTFRPVEIDGMISVTHRLIYREYKIRYHFLDGDREHADILSTPAEMNEFRDNIATAEIHAGRLGWSWVKGLRPGQNLP